MRPSPPPSRQQWRPEAGRPGRRPGGPRRSLRPLPAAPRPARSCPCLLPRRRVLIVVPWPGAFPGGQTINHLGCRMPYGGRSVAVDLPSAFRRDVPKAHRHAGPWAAPGRIPGALEDSPSGLWRSLGKRVGGNPSGVRISHPPQIEPRHGGEHEQPPGQRAGGESLAQERRGQCRGGQGLEQRHDRRDRPGDAAQAREEHGVGERARHESQIEQHPQRHRVGGEAQSRQQGDRRQQQRATREPGEGHRDPGRHADPGESDDGVAERRPDGEQCPEHDCRPGVGTGGDAHEQDQPYQGGDEGGDGRPLGPPVPENGGADGDQQRGQPERDQCRDAHPGRGDRGEVGQLVGRQPRTDEGEPGCGRAGEGRGRPLAAVAGERVAGQQDDRADRHAVPGDVERTEAGAVGHDPAADSRRAPAECGEHDEEEPPPRSRRGREGRGGGHDAPGTVPGGDSDPEHGTVTRQAGRPCCGGGSARGAPGQERGGERTRACRGVMGGKGSGSRRRPAAPVLYSGGQTPRVASSCEPPQGRKAARISGLWRGRGGAPLVALPRDTHRESSDGPATGPPGPAGVAPGLSSLPRNLPTVALALSRKYRPATFAEVVGQEPVTTPLMNAVDGGRINHAYLFSGPRGCGKTSSARILARSLNCAQGPTSTPCGVCESCIALAPDGPGSLDVMEIDAASHGGVDDARDLRERAFFAPVNSRYKVYIVDEAHMVTTQGFNALLKVVEEPPDFLVFVFATTEPDKVLPTIRSRTHHYPFRLVPPTTLRGLLEKTCAAEGVQVEHTVFPLVVRAGGGSVRDSLSILDQLLAGAGPEGVTYKSAVGLLGVTDDALLDETIDALAAHDAPAVFRAVDRVVEAGHDPRRFATDLLDRLRDLIVLDAVPQAGGNGLLDSPSDRLDLMSQQAQALGSATLSRMADTVHEGLTEMRGTTAPRLLLELVCARMLLPGTDGSATATLQRLERLERRMSIAGEHAGRPAAEGAPVQQAQQAPVRPAAAPAAAPTSAGSRPAYVRPSQRAQAPAASTAP